MPPTRFVALLRGVNVGGVTITNSALSDTFAREGFENIRTVLASGNVAFSPADYTGVALDIKAKIEGALRRDFDYDAWIVLRAQERLAQIAKNYPFARTDETDHPYVVFSSNQDVAVDLLAEGAGILTDVEALEAGDGALYWRVPKGSSLDTPFAKLIAKARYKPHLTTRNLRTVEKLVTA